MYIWVLWGVRIQGFLGAKGHKDKDSSLLGYWRPLFWRPPRSPRRVSGFRVVVVLRLEKLVSIHPTLAQMVVDTRPRS